ncbi:hypothetical protein LXL04_039264 [Taraxacum kok-saghyz]
MKIEALSSVFLLGIGIGPSCKWWTKGHEPRCVGVGCYGITPTPPAKTNPFIIGHPSICPPPPIFFHGFTSRFCFINNGITPPAKKNPFKASILRFLSGMVGLHSRCFKDSKLPIVNRDILHLCLLRCFLWFVIFS